MCTVNLSIVRRGLQNLRCHWKGAEHNRLEQKLRIMNHRPLLDKSCWPVLAEEDRKIRLERMVEPPVCLESTLGLSLEERVELEKEEAEENARPTFRAESAAYLWLYFFLNCLGSVTNFWSLMRLIDGWVTSMGGDMSFTERSLSVAKCQVVT